MPNYESCPMCGDLVDGDELDSNITGECNMCEDADLIRFEDDFDHGEW